MSIASALAREEVQGRVRKFLETYGRVVAEDVWGVMVGHKYLRNPDKAEQLMNIATGLVGWSMAMQLRKGLKEISAAIGMKMDDVVVERVQYVVLTRCVDRETIENTWKNHSATKRTDFVRTKRTANTMSPESTLRIGYRIVRKVVSCMVEMMEVEIMDYLFPPRGTRR